MAVMQLLNKDPSLAFERVKRTVSTGGLSRIAEAHIVQLCAEFGMAAGYVFAVNHGFHPDTVLADGMTLVDHALKRSSASELSLLLALGASPCPRPVDDEYHGTLFNALSQALQPGHPVGDLGAVTMLLDAKAPLRYSPAAMCPLSLVLASGGWQDEASRKVLFRLMARMVKEGAPLDEATGSPKMTPILRAIGARNGEGVVAMIRLGADTSTKALNGRDLFELLEKSKLGDYAPAATSALMERRIAQAKSEAAAQRVSSLGAEPGESSVQGHQGSDEQPAATAKARRRMGPL
jgi:hypothetical protein